MSNWAKATGSAVNILLCFILQGLGFPWNLSAENAVLRLGQGLLAAEGSRRALQLVGPASAARRSLD